MATENGEAQQTVERIQRDMLARDRRIRDLHDKFSQLVPDVQRALEERDLLRNPPPPVFESIEKHDPQRAQEIRRLRNRRVRFTLAGIGLALAVFLFPIRDTVTSAGSIVPRRSCPVKTTLAGTIERVYFAEGDTVPQGAVLATVQDQAFQNSLDEFGKKRAVTKEQWQSAKIEQARWWSERARVRRLVAGDALPPSRLADAQYQLDLAASGVRERERELEFIDAQINSIRKNRASVDLRSPIEGILMTWAMQNVEGQFVPEGTTIAEVGSADTVLESMVKESDRSKVRVGADVETVFDADSSRSYHGRVVKVAHTIGVARKDFWTKTDVFAVQIQLDETPREMAMGLTANVTITSKNRRIGSILFRPFLNWMRRQFPQVHAV